MPEDLIEIENINMPGRTERVNRAKHTAMREPLLTVLPDEVPGLKVADAKVALLPLLPDDIFPHGKTAGWWLKAIRLDLEVKGVIQRAPGKPVQLFLSFPRLHWSTHEHHCIHHRRGTIGRGLARLYVA